MLTCQQGRRAQATSYPLTQGDTCGSVYCPTGKTTEPGKEKKEPLAVNALESKEDFQYVNDSKIVSKTTVALRVAQEHSKCQTSVFVGRGIRGIVEQGKIGETGREYCGMRGKLWEPWAWLGGTEERLRASHHLEKSCFGGK